MSDSNKADVFAILTDAGAARGAAISAVCDFVNGADFGPGDAKTLDALATACKNAKIPAKLVGIVRGILAFVQVGGTCSGAAVRAVNYK